jgi:methyl-accepting chemotaxis protein
MTELWHSVESIAAVSEENSAASDEVSAATEKMSAQARTVSSIAEDLARRASSLDELVANFKTSGSSFGDPEVLIAARRRLAA